MKAKDTVIETEVANLGDCPHPQSLIQAIRMEQAEVSFKAGIKEAAVWVEKTAPAAYRRRPDWQAKLKSWGIE